LPQSDEDLILVLNGLGLTCVQAKTYIALNQLGEAATEAIAKTAQIARQHVYEPLSALEKIGLVQRILINPPKYKVLPIKEAVNVLKEIQNKRRLELESKIPGLIQYLESNSATQTQPEEIRTTLLNGVEAFDYEIGKAIDSSQISIDDLATSELFRHGMFYGGVFHREALKREVQYRHVICEPENEPPTLGDEDLRKNPLWKVRFCSSPQPFLMTIVDKKKVFILTPPEAAKDTSCYVSNNPCFLILAQTFYDILWENASTEKVP
jgi:predicted transcriptional regulator